MPHILLLGGHGKISLLLTPKLLSRSWNVTSLIRTAEQKPTILDASKYGSGNVDVLVSSLQDVKSDEAAKKILQTVKPDWVVWSAGAGGKGGPSMTQAIDRDACIHFIRASVSTPTITKFLLVSTLTSRRKPAPWWDEAEWKDVQHVNTEVMPGYYKAKLAADEVLTVLGEKRQTRDEGFKYVIVRPGRLEDGQETGKVQLGRTEARGGVRRADVAEVVARLLEKDGVKGWVDLLGGKGDVGEEVEKVVRESIDSREGEDLEVMKTNIA